MQAKESQKKRMKQACECGELASRSEWVYGGDVVSGVTRGIHALPMVWLDVEGAEL